MEKNTTLPKAESVTPSPLPEKSVSASSQINAKIVPQEPEETVSIKKTELATLLARLERVEAAADKGQLAQFDAMHKDKVGKTCRLWTIDGKVIISWENMLTNNVERNQITGGWKEDQTTKVHYEDGTSEEMPLVFFTRRTKELFGKVIKESKDSDTGDIFWTVKSDDGRVYEDINIKFIN